MIVHLFQEMKFFHACPKHGQETMKPRSVTLKSIKEGMKLVREQRNPRLFPFADTGAN